MIFDKLAGIAERSGNRLLISTLQKAKIFRFDGNPREVLPKAFTPEEEKIFREDFFLPFPTIAIEDPISCVLLQDTEENQRGVRGARRFIECAEVHEAMVDLSRERAQLTEKEVAEYKEFIKTVLDKYREPHMVHMGWLKHPDAPTNVENDFIIEGQVETSMLAHKDGVDRLSSTTEVLRNVSTAIEEVFYFNSPFRFVVEVSPTQRRVPGRKGPSILRSHDRPTYTLLTPREIRERLHIGEPGEHEKRTPHWRRRHFRYLQSEYYKSKRGQRIVIEAHWIGPTEKIIDGKRYVVRTDL